MKVLTVRQPWASLIVAGIKTIETRPAPPNGPMRPPGVRGLPGLSIEPGERIGIHAAAAPLQPVEGWKRTSFYAIDTGARIPAVEQFHEDGTVGLVLCPLGALVGTVEVPEVLPIVGEGGAASATPRIQLLSSELFRFTGTVGEVEGMVLPECLDVSDQLPLGDFTPGRWAWILAEPEPCDPQPMQGRQGVWGAP